MTSPKHATAFENDLAKSRSTPCSNCGSTCTLGIGICDACRPKYCENCESFGNFGVAYRKEYDQQLCDSCVSNHLIMMAEVESTWPFAVTLHGERVAIHTTERAAIEDVRERCALYYPESDGSESRLSTADFAVSRVAPWEV